MDILFESFVNSERCKTLPLQYSNSYSFESFVNSERCKTAPHNINICYGLRALLIQKDVKLYYNVTTDTLRLRALLI